MPELPDLQVFSKNLTSKLSGKKIKSISVPSSGKLNVSVATLRKHLEGKKIRDVARLGKELHIHFSEGETLALHLMLRGQLHYFEQKHTERFPIIELYFSDGTGLVLTDYQRAATPTLNPEERDTLDALDSEMNFTFLKNTLSRKKSAIKNVLLDQKVIRGIGNAYADEILWDARISPFSICNKIPEDTIKVLAKSIKKVLKDAEKHISKNYPGIIAGEVRDFMSVHNHKRTHSPTGAPILHATNGGRKTYYTEEQKIYK